MFRPLPKVACRDILNVPHTAKVVLFSAIGGAANPTKGFALLRQAVDLLAASDRAQDLQVLVIGASSVPGAKQIGVPVRCLGHLSDDLTVALVNSAADLVVAPSRQDNLPNAVIEAFACATPVVAFDVGGMPDLIEPKVNGMLAPPFDIRALADAIAWILEEPDRLRDMGREARAKVEREYSLSVLARRYSALYEELVQDATR